MAGLREEVEAAQTLDGIADAVRIVRLAADEHADVAGLGVDVAADVDDAPRGEAEELVQEVGVAPLARRIEDHDGLVGRVAHALEELAGVGGDEVGLRGGEIVGFRVGAREGYRLLCDVNARAALEETGEGDGEQAGA